MNRTEELQKEIEELNNRHIMVNVALESVTRQSEDRKIKTDEFMIRSKEMMREIAVIREKVTKTQSELKGRQDAINEVREWYGNQIHPAQSFLLDEFDKKFKRGKE